LPGLAAGLGLELELLVRTCLEPDGPVWSVKTGPDGDCFFYRRNSRSCLIHESKPLTCRLWPFFRAILDSQGGFSGAEDACPGLEGWDREDFLAAFEALDLPRPPRRLKEAVQAGWPDRASRLPN
jgi:Fe-S-cluster containining protein